MKFTIKKGIDNTAPDGLSRITDVQGELTAITAYVPTWVKELHNSIEGEHPLQSSLFLLWNQSLAPRKLITKLEF